MKKTLAALLIGLFLMGCGEQAFDKLGNIEYRRGGNECSANNKNHWLLDLQASDKNDSMYLNTLALQRKIEVHVLQIDSSSDLYSLLANTCKGDSIDMTLRADEFYKSLGGSVPAHLNDSETIATHVWMRDKLDDIEHIAYKKMYESQMMASFISSNGWDADLDSFRQIYFERLKTNNNERVIEKNALVSFVIKSLSNKLIMRSKEGEPFVYDANDKRIIKGIQYMVENLAIGESARAVISSDYAYGSDGNSKVPGYTPIIIELEVLDRAK